MLAETATAPDRTNRMDDVPSRQPITFSYPGFSGRTSTEKVTFLQQLRARRAMNGAIDTGSAEQRRIRRVDDGVHGELRDIAVDDLDAAEDGRKTSPAGLFIRIFSIPRLPLSFRCVHASDAPSIFGRGYLTVIQAKSSKPGKAKIVVRTKKVSQSV